jgi:hypothetical protein
MTSVGATRTTKQRGFSLAEAFIALSLLVATIIMSATIYQSVFQMGRKLESRLDLAYESRRQLVAARHWLRDPENFRHFSTYRPDISEASQVEVDVVIDEFETASPNSTFEDGFSDKRSMNKSFLLVTVRVKQGTFLSEMTGIVGAPRRELSRTEPIQITPEPRVLGPRETIELTAILRDSAGRTIEDVFFEWSVRPISGVATLTDVSRNGRQAQLQNISYKRDGTPILTGGTCLVGAGTTYGGQEIWEFSSEVRLAP